CQIHASMNSCHGTGKPFTTAIIPSKPDYARGSLRMLTFGGNRKSFIEKVRPKAAIRVFTLVTGVDQFL
ncbi:hypothetical protein, partial [Acetobacter fallax]|uniref:hypothetical protein n=1 Tax=Acetobacter fallax TaxID=1737473 RepID=UPI001A7E6485